MSGVDVSQPREPEKVPDWPEVAFVEGEGEGGLKTVTAWTRGRDGQARALRGHVTAYATPDLVRAMLRRTLEWYFSSDREPPPGPREIL